MTDELDKEASEQIDKIIKHLPKVIVATSILFAIPVVAVGAALATAGASVATLALGSAVATVGLYRAGYNTIHRNKFANLLAKNLKSTQPKEQMTPQEIKDEGLENVSKNFFSSITAMKNHVIFQGAQHAVVAAAGITLLATITGGFWLPAAAILMAVTGTIGTVKTIKRLPKIRSWEKRFAKKTAATAKKVSKPSATPSPSNTLDNTNKPSADFEQVNDNTPTAETKEPANDVAPKVKDKNKPSN